MELILKLLKSRNIIVIMIYLIMFYLPIVLITDKWYRFMYGDYLFKYDIQYCIDNFNNNSISCFVFICTLVIVSNLIITKILPNIMPLISKKIQTKKSTIKAYVFVKKITHISLSYMFKSVNIRQLRELQTDIMFIPCSFLLWSIYFNSIWIYPLIFIAFYLTYLIVSISETQFHEHNRNIE